MAGRKWAPMALGLAVLIGLGLWLNRGGEMTVTVLPRCIGAVPEGTLVFDAGPMGAQRMPVAAACSGEAIAFTGYDGATGIVVTYIAPDGTELEVTLLPDSDIAPDHDGYATILDVQTDAPQIAAGRI